MSGGFSPVTTKLNIEEEKWTVGAPKYEVVSECVGTRSDRMEAMETKATFDRETLFIWLQKRRIVKEIGWYWMQGEAFLNDYHKGKTIIRYHTFLLVMSEDKVYNHTYVVTNH